MFTTAALKQAIRTFLATVLALGFGIYFHLEQMYWLILTTILLTQIRGNAPVWRHLVMILLTGLTAAILVFLVSTLTQPYLVLMVTLLTGFCVYIGLKNADIFLPIFLLNFLVLLASGLPQLAQGTERFIAMLLACGIAIFVNLCCWPQSVKQERNKLLKQFFVSLSQLQKTFCLIYLDKTWQKNEIHYERKIYLSTAQILYIVERLRHLSIPATLLNLLEKVYVNVLSLGNLRYRVSDHSTFEIIHPELKKLCETIQAILLNLTQKKPPSLEPFEHNILALEEVYRSALQVAAREPLVFLLYIAALKNLQAQLALLIAELHHE